MRRRADAARQRLLRAESALLARRPHAVLAARRKAIERVASQFREVLTGRVLTGVRLLERQQLDAAARKAFARAEATLEERQGVLEAVGPEAVLARGYSVTTDADGGVIRNAEEVSVGSEIQSRLAVGTIRSTVNETGPASGDQRRK
jgi:exodeoxyribonuclease VII large subunit